MVGISISTAPARVHFLADHGLDLAQHAQAQRRPRVEPGGELADHAGLQHQLVADDFGVGGRFLAGAEMELRQAHRRTATNRAGRSLCHAAQSPGFSSLPCDCRGGLGRGAVGSRDAEDTPFQPPLPSQREEQSSLPRSIHLDAIARLHVDALVLASLGRLVGDLQRAAGVAPAVQHRAGILGIGGGRAFGALLLLALRLRAARATATRPARCRRPGRAARPSPAA